jgi:DNA-binding NtrC family response regulator
LGDGRRRKVDVQIVTATNADLSGKIKALEFRYDLWARLNGMSVTLPSLERRGDDIPLLLMHLLRCQALSRRLPLPSIPLSLLPRLVAYPWSGNVRGLRSYAQRVFDLSRGEVPDESAFLAALPDVCDASLAIAHASALPHAFPEEKPPATLTDRLQQLRLSELALLAEALDRTRDPVTGAINRAKAAALLKGKSRCSTNEFDRWVSGVWKMLTSVHQEHAMEQFPDLLHSLKLNKEVG